MTWKAVAICDDCWDAENPRQPSPRLPVGEHEVCYRCGHPTCSGIYVRRNVPA